jgi:hypothetical protein
VKNLEIKAFTDLMTSAEEAVKSGDTDKAIEIFTKSIELYPEYTDEHDPYEPLADAYAPFFSIVNGVGADCTLDVDYYWMMGERF